VLSGTLARMSGADELGAVFFTNGRNDTPLPSDFVWVAFTGEVLRVGVRMNQKKRNEAASASCPEVTLELFLNLRRSKARRPEKKLLHMQCSTMNGTVNSFFGGNCTHITWVFDVPIRSDFLPSFSNRDCQFLVSYTLKASVSAFFTKTVCVESPVWVLPLTNADEPLLFPLSHPNRPPEAHCTRVHGGISTGRGTLAVNAYLDRPSYMCGEYINVKLNINNDAPVIVKSIVVDLQLMLVDSERKELEYCRVETTTGNLFERRIDSWDRFPYTERFLAFTNTVLGEDKKTNVSGAKTPTARKIMEDDDDDVAAAKQRKPKIKKAESDRPPNNKGKPKSNPAKSTKIEDDCSDTSDEDDDSATMPVMKSKRKAEKPVETSTPEKELEGEDDDQKKKPKSKPKTKKSEDDCSESSDEDDSSTLQPAKSKFSEEESHKESDKALSTETTTTTMIKPDKEPDNCEDVEDQPAPSRSKSKSKKPKKTKGCSDDSDIDDDSEVESEDEYDDLKPSTPKEGENYECKDEPTTSRPKSKSKKSKEIEDDDDSSSLVTPTKGSRKMMLDDDSEEASIKAEAGNVRVPKNSREVLNFYIQSQSETRIAEWKNCVRKKRIVPGKNVECEFQVRIPDCSEITPTFCYGQHYVTHTLVIKLLKVAASPVRNSPWDYLAIVNIPVFVCTWRGIPNVIRDRGLYDKILELARDRDSRFAALQMPKMPVPLTLSDAPVERTYGDADFEGDSGQIPSEPDSVDDELPRRTEGGDGKLCKLCHQRQCTFCVVPCGHRCLCKECADMLQQNKGSKCPVCRMVCQFVMRVYDS